MYDNGMFDEDFYSYSMRPSNRGALTGSSGGYQAPSQDEQTAKTLDTVSKASLPFMETPVGAGVAVGSQFLSQYLAQKAADERAKRDRSVQIAQQHSQGEQQGIDQLINVYRGALR